MDGEAKAIQILSQTLLSKEKKMNEELMECHAALNAIRKISTNKAIQALCDMDFDDGK